MSLLKLDELYQAQEKRTRSNRRVYDEILKQCHRRILSINKQIQLTQCYFSIPPYIFGYPAYDLEDVNEWLCKQLGRNGFLVYPIDIQTIYICWDPSVIDYERYQKNLHKDGHLTFATESELMAMNNAEKDTDSIGRVGSVGGRRIGSVGGNTLGVGSVGNTNKGIRNTGATSVKQTRSKIGRARANKISMSHDQPLAVIKFDNDFEDLIPVNTKKLKTHKPPKPQKTFPWF